MANANYNNVTDLAQHQAQKLLGYAGGQHPKGKLATLPFIEIDPTDMLSYWEIPEPKSADYDEACDLGVSYADQYCQYIVKHAESPELKHQGALLADIFRSMEANKADYNHGYRVGFIDRVEELFVEQAKQLAELKQLVLSTKKATSTTGQSEKLTQYRYVSPYMRKGDLSYLVISVIAHDEPTARSALAVSLKPVFVGQKPVNH